MKPKYKQLAYFFVTFLFVCIIAGVVVFSYFTLQEIQNQSKVTLSGVVADSVGKPVQGASVMVEGRLVQTDVTGSYTLRDLRWGWSQLKVEADNYLPYLQDIYLPFGKISSQRVLLESVNYAILRGSIYSGDNQQFDLNKQQIIFKVNSIPVLLKSDNTFETDKIAIQKISILIQVPEFEDYYKTVTLTAGINNIGPIKLNKKVSQPKIQLKNVTSEKIVANQEISLNKVIIQTDEDGFLQLENTQLKNGDVLNLKINGFKEKNVIYLNSQEPLIIFVEENKTGTPPQATGYLQLTS
jgi:Carboxypeptidase regulatory-like domain